MKCVILFRLLGLKSINSSSTAVTDENWPVQTQKKSHLTL